jgi:leucyl-tRNA synthetase
MRRFLDRVHAIAHRPLADEALDGETAKLVHRTVKKVTEDIEALRFNTAISAMMILANHLAGQPSPSREAVEKLLLCLSPYAPHLAEELWSTAGHAASIADAPWPSYDEALTIDDVVELAVQVNGRVRGRILLPRDAESDQAREAALQEPNVAKHVEGRAVKKFIYVPGRIANLIVA